MKAEHARFISYLLGAAVGAAVTILGAVRGDPVLMTAGIGLLGTGSLAGANVNGVRHGKHASD